MKLHDILTEAPGLISDTDEFDLKYPKTNSIRARQILNNPKSVIIWSYNDHIHLYELKNTYALVDTIKFTILYWVKYEITYSKFTEKQTVTQVEVWREKGEQQITSGIPKTVFYEILLPKTGNMLTDVLQTKDGKGFWLDRIGDAFKLGLYVYYVSLIPPREIIQLHNLQDVYTVEHKTWGNPAHIFRTKKIIITTTPIDNATQLT